MIEALSAPGSGAGGRGAGEEKITPLSDEFFDSLDDDWQAFGDLLGEAVLAACLLGYDLAVEEKKIPVATAPGSDFDEPNPIAAEAGPVSLRFDVPPKEAIDYFERKQVMPAKQFYALEREARAGAFTVSGVYKQDILDGFKSEIAKALRNGTPQREVIKNFKSILAGAGHDALGNHHLETVVRTNMAMAHGVGRRREMEASKDLLPFWQYSAVGDDRTRPTHMALDGIVLPADHAFWDEHYPPWDFRCRCSVIALPDMPDGYDHKSPNPDTEISYDADGMPIKASYGTTVYDLSAGKFTGVPRQTNLQAVLENGAAKAGVRGRGLGVGETRPPKGGTPNAVQRVAKATQREARREASRIYQTPATVTAEARQLRFADHAVTKFFNPAGQPAPISRSTGMIRLRNHVPALGPDYESFAVDEVAKAAEMDLVEDLLVTRDYQYSMRPGAAGWGEKIISQLSLTYDEIHASIAAELLEEIRSGRMTQIQADSVHRHLTWKQLARRFRLKYSRKRFS